MRKGGKGMLGWDRVAGMVGRSILGVETCGRDVVAGDREGGMRESEMDGVAGELMAS